MEITASLVKELRERSGAGMMECKKALAENAGDIDNAIKYLRERGIMKLEKQAGRVAAEGRVAMATAPGKAVLVEVNSETDFVAKDDNFVAFANAVAQAALDSGATDVEALKGAKIGGQTVEDARAALFAKVGEKLEVRRMAVIDTANTVVGYIHTGGKIGVLVELKGGDAALAKGIAMHVAAMNPPYQSPAHVPADIVAREKEIALAQVSDKDKSKPAEILEKITSGKVNKVISEMTLTGQAYALDPNQSVEATLKAGKAEIVRFVRLVVGEGIEKVVEDYAAEVAKAMQV